MKFHSIFTIVACAGLVSLGGCKKKGQQTTNAEFAEMYDQHNYDDMLTTEEYETHENQGDAISPRELELIQQTIEEYRGDFEHCLEVEMETLENRWVAGHFSVEFRINTSGQVDQVKVIENEVMERRTQDKEGNYVSEGGAPPRTADGFAGCVEGKLADWEFDPPPETDYVHTYNGQVGEAW